MTPIAEGNYNIIVRIVAPIDPEAKSEGEKVLSHYLEVLSRAHEFEMALDSI